ncbi:hypothetical protein QFZ31_002045 [Neobacillus niacini]|nr:hypothetical protein [Neobacillus niacini]
MRIMIGLYGEMLTLTLYYLSVFVSMHIIYKDITLDYIAL